MNYFRRIFRQNAGEHHNVLDVHEERRQILTTKLPKRIILQQSHYMFISSLIQFARKDDFQKLHLALISISLATLAFAYFVEYVLHYAPCPLCVYQRFPYLILIKLSLTGLIIKKLSKYTFALISLTLLGGCLLAGYHTGIEQGIFEPSAFCSSFIHIPEHLSIENIKEMFYNQPITSCNKAAFKLFGLSMTEWNFILSFSLLSGIILLWIYPQNEKNFN